MAKKVMTTSTILTFDSEKKHSVLYTTESQHGESVVATNVYVSKTVFSGSGSYPTTIKITIENQE